MKTTPPGRWAVLAAAVAMVVAGGAATGSRVAARPTALAVSLTVTPDTALVSGQTVTVDVSGLSPSGDNELWRCPGGATDVASCEEAQTLLPDGAGDATTTKEVWRAEYFPSGYVDCASAVGACEMAVFDAGVLVGAAPLAFDPSVPPPAAAAEASPSTGLASGTLIAVTGWNFVPGEDVLVEECAVDTGDCVAGPGIESRPTVAGDGHFVAMVTAQRGIYHPTGWRIIDCAAAPGACVVRVEGPDSGRVDLPLEFVATAVDVAVTVTPHDQLVDRQVVEVQASGFVPYELVFVSECSPDFVVGVLCGPGPTQVQADGNGRFTVAVAVTDRYSFWGPDAPTAIDCTTAVGNCTMRVVAAADPIRLVEVPLGFAKPVAAPRFTG